MNEVYTNLDVCVDYDEYYTQRPDPDDSWDAGQRSCNYLGTTARLVESKYDSGDSWVPKIGDWIYVVIEVCDEGCTFGSTKNIPGYRDYFKTREEADQYTVETLEDNDYFGGHVRWQIECVKVEGCS